MCVAKILPIKPFFVDKQTSRKGNVALSTRLFLYLSTIHQV